MRWTTRIARSFISPSEKSESADRFNPTQVYDIHATILHLLGIDHLRLTVRHNGIDRRLTDVHGRVIDDHMA